MHLEVSSAEVDRLLARMGVSPKKPGVRFLHEVQQRWMFCQPFHNLDLLAGFAKGREPLDRREAWLRCVDGLGGPCHVQASSFLALLRALGFEATFCAATITHPGDHLVVGVHVDGAVWLCDVGNGHPYLAPFPFEGASEQSHLGWSIRSAGDGHTLCVEQRVPGSPVWRTVYEARPTPRAWEDFREAVRRHHLEPGFGPFLTGLRAVRVSPSEVHTLRDDQYTRHNEEGVIRFEVDSDHEELLKDSFRLSDLPVDVAVACWRQNRGGA